MPYPPGYPPKKIIATYLVTLDGARDGVDGRRDALTGVDVVE